MIRAGSTADPNAEGTESLIIDGRHDPVDEAHPHGDAIARDPVDQPRVRDATLHHYVVSTTSGGVKSTARGGPAPGRGPGRQCSRGARLRHDRLNEPDTAFLEAPTEVCGHSCEFGPHGDVKAESRWR